MPRQAHSIAAAQAQIDGVAPFLPDHLEVSAVKCLEEAMDATCFVRSGLDAEGRRNYVEVPDHAIRLMAAVRVLEFRRGKPVSSAIVAHLTPGAPPDVRRADALRDLCTRNPELIENIIRNLAQTQKPVIEAETCARVEMDPQKSPTG